VAGLNDPAFGRAYYGVSGTGSRYGELPLNSEARRVQLGMRLSF
jgi:hypothetical protein